MYGRQIELNYQNDPRFTCCCGIHVKTCAAFLAVYHGLSLFAIVPGTIILSVFTATSVDTQKSHVLLIPLWLILFWIFVSTVTFLFAVCAKDSGFVWPMRIHYGTSLLISLSLTILLIISGVLLLMVLITGKGQRKLLSSSKRYHYYNRHMNASDLAIVIYYLICLLTSGLACLFNYYCYLLVTRYQKYLRKRSAAKNHWYH